MKIYLRREPQEQATQSNKVGVKGKVLFVTKETTWAYYRAFWKAPERANTTDQEKPVKPDPTFQHSLIDYLLL